MRAGVRLCHVATMCVPGSLACAAGPTKGPGPGLGPSPVPSTAPLVSSVAAAGLSRNRGRIEGLCAALSCLTVQAARLCRHLPRNYQRVLDCSGSTPGPTDGPITSRSWPLPGLSTALARLGTAQVPRSKPLPADSSVGGAPEQDAAPHRRPIPTRTERSASGQCLLRQRRPASEEQLGRGNMPGLSGPTDYPDGSATHIVVHPTPDATGRASRQWYPSRTTVATNPLAGQSASVRDRHIRYAATKPTTACPASA